MIEREREKERERGEGATKQTRGIKREKVGSKVGMEASEADASVKPTAKRQKEVEL